MTCWIDENQSLGLLRESLTRLHKAISILKEAESNPSHKLYALQDRYAEHRAVETAVEASKAKIAAFLEDHEKIATVHQRVISNLTNGQLSKWTSEVANLSSKLGQWSSESIAHFLRSAGQNQLLEQVEKAETGLRISLDKMKASLLLGLQLLGHCITMTSMYPKVFHSFFAFLFCL